MFTPIKRILKWTAAFALILGLANQSVLADHNHHDKDKETYQHRVHKPYHGHAYKHHGKYESKDYYYNHYYYPTYYKKRTYRDGSRFKRNGYRHRSHYRGPVVVYYH